MDDLVGFERTSSLSKVSSLLASDLKSLSTSSSETFAVSGTHIFDQRLAAKHAKEKVINVPLCFMIGLSLTKRISGRDLRRRSGQECRRD